MLFVEIFNSQFSIPLFIPYLYTPFVLFSQIFPIVETTLGGGDTYMTDKKNKKTTAIKKTVKGMKGGMSTVAPIIGGAVTGAIVGGVAGAIAADEKKRKVVSEIGSNMADYAADAIDAVSESASDAQDAVRGTAEKTIEATKKNKAE